VKLGLIARVEGKGFVVAQDPPAGTALDAVSGCRVTLGRTTVAAQEQPYP
jgi:hypothetical protein